MNEFEYWIHKHLRTLITLLYGLALATGLEYAIPEIFDCGWLQKLQYAPLAFMAFIVGLSDWVVYHVAVAPYLYKNPGRILLDVVFPIVVYMLFVAASSFELFLDLLMTYSGLSLFYLFLLSREQLNVDRLLISQYSISLVVSFFVRFWLCRMTVLISLSLPALLVLLLAGMWLVLSGRLLYLQITAERNRVRGKTPDTGSSFRHSCGL